ncbi:MAG: hypothetical protein RI897_2609 [Verrucomicrobiota bacterium]
MGGVGGAEVQGVAGDAGLGVGAEGVAGIGVGVEAGCAAGGDVDTDLVVGCKDDGGGPEVDVEGDDVVGLEEGFAIESMSEAGSEHAFAEVEGAAIGVDIAEADEEVGIGCVAGDPDTGGDLAGDFEGLCEFGGGEDEDVVTGFDWVLVHWAGGEGELDTADGGGGVGGVVGVGEGLVFVGRGGGEGVVVVEVVGCWGGGEWGPGIGRAPDVARGIGVGGIADDVVGDGGFGVDFVGLVFEPAIEPAPLVGVLAGRVFAVGEGEVADFILEDVMAPGAEEEFLFSAGVGAAVVLVTVEGVDGGLGEDIPVTADMEGGGVDFWIVA